MISAVRGKSRESDQIDSEVMTSERRPEGSEGENPGQHVNMCKGPEAQEGQCDG